MSSYPPRGNQPLDVFPEPLGDVVGNSPSVFADPKPFFPAQVDGARFRIDVNPAAPTLMLVYHAEMNIGQIKRDGGAFRVNRRWHPKGQLGQQVSYASLSAALESIAHGYTQFLDETFRKLARDDAIIFLRGEEVDGE